MNRERTDRILRTLLRAGRNPSPLDDSKAGYGFETRLLATIRAQAGQEDSRWLLWHRVLWRTVPVVAVVALILCATLWFKPNGTGDSLTVLADPLGFELVLTDFLGGNL